MGRIGAGLVGSAAGFAGPFGGRRAMVGVVKPTRLRAIPEQRSLTQRELAGRAPSARTPIEVRDEAHPGTARLLAIAAGVEPAVRRG